MPQGVDFPGGTLFDNLNLTETREQRLRRIETAACVASWACGRPEERESRDILLKEEEGCFRDTPGRYEGTQHEINTGSARPVASKGFRNPKVANPEFHTQLLEWEAAGIIERSTSPWAAPVLIVPKKSGKFRTVIDYRRLNQLIPKEENPVPRIVDILDTLGGSQFFTSLDLTSGYYQLGVKKANRFL